MGTERREFKPVFKPLSVETLCLAKIFLFMRVAILVTAMFLSVNCFSQKKGGYLSFSPVVDIIKKSSASIGGELSGNGAISDNAYLGFNVGFTKSQNIKHPYCPVLLKFTLIPQKDKLSPLLVVSPGYIVYNQSQNIGPIEITTKGRFSFYGGAGIASKPMNNSRLFLTIGYARYEFTINEVKAAIEGLGIRAGIMIR